MPRFWIRHKYLSFEILRTRCPPRNTDFWTPTGRLLLPNTPICAALKNRMLSFWCAFGTFHIFTGLVNSVRKIEYCPFCLFSYSPFFNPFWLFAKERREERLTFWFSKPLHIRNKSIDRIGFSEWVPLVFFFFFVLTFVGKRRGNNSSFKKRSGEHEEFFHSIGYLICIVLLFQIIYIQEKQQQHLLHLHHHHILEASRRLHSTIKLNTQLLTFVFFRVSIAFCVLTWKRYKVCLKWKTNPSENLKILAHNCALSIVETS